MMQHLSEELLNAYLDGVLEAQAREAADAHLADCPACQARFNDLRHLFTLLSALRDEPMAVDLSATAWEQALPVRPARRRLAAGVLTVEGGLALILLALVWPRFLPALNAAEAGLLMAWNGWLFRQTAIFDLGAWRASLAGVSALPAVFWQAWSAAIGGPSLAWGMVLVGAFAAWWVGNRLLLRGESSSMGQGGSHG